MDPFRPVIVGLEGGQGALNAEPLSATTAEKKGRVAREEDATREVPH
jgi:hypothetical protein